MTEKLKAWKAIPIPENEYKELKEKADNYDELRKCLQFPNASNEFILKWFYSVNKGNQEKRNQLKAVNTLRDELAEYDDFVKRASRTHGIANEEHYKAKMEILSKLNEILGPEEAS